jgi:hypothetical protein
MALEPNEDIQWIADTYNHLHRHDINFQKITRGHYVEVDKERAERIAIEYNRLPVEDEGFMTRWCYKSLLWELVNQWNVIKAYDYTLEPWTKEGQPYANSAEMRADLRDNKHLFFFTGGEPHPFLGDVVEETGFTGNEMLRAVHDVFGHAAEGFGFGARGEENAWIHHSMMFSPLAQRALTTETRGQNSWVNFGPNSHLPVTERPYADQKVALLPEWVCDWREALNG